MGSNLKLVTHDLSLCLFDLGTQFGDFGLEIPDCMFAAESDRVEDLCSFLILTLKQKVKVFDLILQRRDKCLLANSETKVEFLLGIHLGHLCLEFSNGILGTIRGTIRGTTLGTTLGTRLHFIDLGGRTKLVTTNLVTRLHFID